MPVRQVWRWVPEEDAAIRRDQGAIALLGHDVAASLMSDETGADAIARELGTCWSSEAQEQHAQVRYVSKIDAVRRKKRRLCAGPGHKQPSGGQKYAVLEARIARTDRRIAGQSCRLD